MMRFILVLFGLGFAAFAVAVLQSLPFSAQRAAVIAIGSVAAVISLICFASAPIRRRSLHGAVIVNVIAAIVACYAGEIYVASKQDSVHNKVRAMRAGGEDVVYKYWSDSLMVDGVEYVTIYGFPDIYTLFCNEVRVWVSYRADEIGYNNPKGIWNEKLDAVLVGDSFTHGACEETSNTIAGRMRASGLKVASAGYSQAGPLRELAALVETVARYRPPIVYWNYFSGNDLKDLKTEGAMPVLPRYRDEPGFTQDLYANRDKIDPAHRAQFEQYLTTLTQSQMVSWKDVLLLRNIRARLQLSVRGGMPESTDIPTPEELADLEKVLRRAHDVVAGWGGELRFVYLPYESELAEATAVTEKTRALVKATAGRAGLKIIDLTPRFQEEPNARGLFNFYNGHYATSGYAVVAKTLADDLRNRLTPAK